VKDKNNRSFTFTPYALPCNIDFETMAEEGNQVYRYEELSQTYSKLALLQPEAYKDAWNLWKEGIKERLLCPQFHGREHLNLKLFEEKLRNKDKEVLINLKNRSYTNISDLDFENIGYTAAFSFEEKDDQKEFMEILETGISNFVNVFGFKPRAFTPPASQFPLELESELENIGLWFYDKPFQASRHLGSGKYKRQFNFLGLHQKNKLVTLVRNVVFEPTEERGIDWVNYSLMEIEAAFFWNKPAIISSLRVNFCGHIDPKNREKGLSALKQLLHEIINKWPDVEFMSADELGDLIATSEGLTFNNA
jgi:hypothetical protein